jgi:hypothetical protein
MIEINHNTKMHHMSMTQFSRTGHRTTARRMGRRNTMLTNPRLPGPGNGDNIVIAMLLPLPGPGRRGFVNIVFLRPILFVVVRWPALLNCVIDMWRILVLWLISIIFSIRVRASRSPRTGANYRLCSGHAISMLLLGVTMFLPCSCRPLTRAW